MPDHSRHVVIGTEKTGWYLLNLNSISSAHPTNSGKSTTVRLSGVGDFDLEIPFERFLEKLGVSKNNWLE